MNGNYKSTKSVVIIGGGVSGLSTALHLNKLGWKNVTILEARDRFGGRVYSKPLGKNTVEIGAQWIHGEDGNAIFNLASKHDLVDESAPSFVDLTRSSFPSAFKPKFRRLVLEIMDDLVEGEALKEFQSTSLGGRAFQYIRNKINASSDAEEVAVIKQVFDLFFRFDSHYNGCDNIYEVASNSKYQNCPGNPTVEWKTNYASVLEVLRNSLGQARIRLNSPVSSIDYSGERVKVFKSDGEYLEADHVVVTVPLGVLKRRADELFRPALPSPKIEAIRKIGYGTVDKIFLKFEKPFWEGNLVVNVYWDDGKNYRGVPDDVAFSGSNEDAWTKFNPEESIPWERSIIYFSYVRHQPNVLCAWIFGGGAEFAETLSDEEVSSGSHRVLSHALRRTDIPKPTEVVRSNWYSDHFSHGSYSFDSVLCYSDGCSKTRADLAEPVFTKKYAKNYPSLLFAGEATHPHFSSTVHGAYESGMREAKRLNDFAKTLGQSHL